MRDLDDPSSYLLDQHGMFKHVECLGAELERAWKASAAMSIPAGTFDGIVIAAMGGSAAAADYFAALVARESATPVSVVRGYELPAFVGQGTLVIALSYSGGTEEVLACHAEATARRAATLAITSGGELATQAAAGTWHPIAYESAPRAAFAHCLAPLLRLGDRLGLKALCDADLAVAAGMHAQLVQDHLGQHVPAASNPAKQLAELLLDASPLVILAAEHLAPAGRRAKNQFAENAKVPALFEEVPEATHNIIVGLETPDGPRASALRPTGIAFSSPKLLPGNQRRLELAATLFEDAGGALAGLQMRATSRLGDLMEATAWGDYLSCYLAILRGVDPTPTPSLHRVRTAMTAAQPQSV